ncbi:MAG TPA: cytochrome P450 [Acidimicrobiales bacterium]|nr:cytochrome P450 [Acidimicrobiales bacterium]
MSIGVHDDIDFALGGDMADLHSVIHSLRGDGPVAQVRYFGEPALLFTTYESVDAAYRDDDLFPAAAAFAEMTEPSMGRTLQCMGGDEHKRNRKLVSPAFRARIMPDYVRPILEEVAHELIDEFVASGEADLVDVFNSRFPGIVITRLLGVPDDNDIDLQHCAHRLLSYPNDPVGALEARAEFTHVLGPLVTRRRRDPQHDLISTLATANAEGDALSDEEIFTFVRLLFAAGTDTTFHGLGTVLYALLTHPAQLERVVADPRTELRWAVEESLRWDPVVSMEPRRAPTATEWFGHSIPAGARVLFGIAAANRDPSVFTAPDDYDVGRRPEPIMTFGIGPHFCLGAHLARVEFVTALGALLDRLPGLTLLDGESTRIHGTVLRGPRQLKVRWATARAAL